MKEYLPNLKIRNFKCGKKVFDWIIPSEWNLNDAFVIDKYEVTAGHFKECVETGPCEYNGSTTEAART